jgi:hypothetical protein
MNVNPSLLATWDKLTEGHRAAVREVNCGFDLMILLTISVDHLSPLPIVRAVTELATLKMSATSAGHDSSLSTKATLRRLGHLLRRIFQLSVSILPPQSVTVIDCNVSAACLRMFDRMTTDMHWQRVNEMALMPAKTQWSSNMLWWM